MKKAIYKGLDGKDFSVDYDPNAPCISCGQPVVSASMGGTAVCSWCDCGKYRDGSAWSIRDAMDGERRKVRAQEIQAKT